MPFDHESGLGIVTLDTGICCPGHQHVLCSLDCSDLGHPPFSMSPAQRIPVQN